MENYLTPNQLDLIPRMPGVYKFHNSNSEILYVGKALNLNSRVKSYFSDTHSDRPQIIPMIPQIGLIEYIETDNEMEALVLESALIKSYKPKFNTDLKDDKSYAWIFISTRDDIPTVQVVRSIKKGEYKRGRLFGPYPNGRATRRLFNYIRKLYPFCTHSKYKKDDSCLYVHMGLCPGPHHGHVTRAEYMKNINEIIKFLQGKKKRHIGGLEKQMYEHSKHQEYEKAANIRDRINDLNDLGTKINFNYYQSEASYKENRKLQLISELESITDEIGAESLERIECYDISNLQGSHAYGSMVVVIDGQKNTSKYRAFKIREKDTPDDYAMLRETLIRRLKYVGKDGNDSLNQRPNMLLIDGGKGQLSVVADVVPDDIILMGISKGKHMKRKGSRKTDEFWVVRSGIVFPIDISSPRILINLRDEAHRFALKHHRKARAENKKKSILDSIAGVGPKSKKALLKKFGSVSNIRKASVEEINGILNNISTSKKIKSELGKKS